MCVPACTCLSAEFQPQCTPTSVCAPCVCLWACLCMMCVSVFLFVHVYTHLCLCLCMCVSVCAHISVCLCTCACLCAVSVCLCFFECTYVHICVCLPMCTHARAPCGTGEVGGAAVHAKVAPHLASAAAPMWRPWEGFRQSLTQGGTDHTGRGLLLGTIFV